MALPRHGPECIQGGPCVLRTRPGSRPAGPLAIAGPPFLLGVPVPLSPCFPSSLSSRAVSSPGRPPVLPTLPGRPVSSPLWSFPSPLVLIPAPLLCAVSHLTHRLRVRGQRPSRRPTRQPQAFCLMPSSALPLSLHRAPYTTLTTPASNSPIVSVLLRGFPSPHPSSPRLAPRAWEGWHCICVSWSCHRQELSACVCLPVLP